MSALQSLWLLALLLTACGVAPSPDPSRISFDIDAPGIPVDTIRLDGPVVWETGGFKDDPGDEIDLLGGIMGLVPLAGERYLLTEGSRVRLFDRSGRELWRTGQAGEGPGDFGGLGWVCQLNGDTVVVLDQANARFAVVLAGVGVVNTIRSNQRYLREGGCNGRGSFLVGLTEPERDSSKNGSPSLSMVVQRLLGNGDTLSSLYHQKQSAQTYTMVGNGNVSFGWADSLFYLADPNRGDIVLMDGDGEVLRTLVWAAPRIPVTDANIPDRYGFAIGEGSAGSAEEAAAYWQQVRSLPRRDFWPAFVMVRPDPLGRLWLRQEFGDGELAQWWVLNTEGRLLGQVALPQRTRERMALMLGFTRDGISFYHEDTDGAAWVSVYRYPEWE